MFRIQCVTFVTLSHLVVRRTFSANAHPLIGVIDQGTSSSRFVVFSTKDGSIISKHQISIQRHHPVSGWVEMWADEIYQSTLQCINEVASDLKLKQISLSRIEAIGLTNQRETVVAWDAKTGQPFLPAIVWSDSRTSKLVQKYIQRAPGRDRHAFQKITGLPLSSYFTALKIRWLLDNVPLAQRAALGNRLRVGTVDSWLIDRLTCGRCYTTDVTNASRTLLFNLTTLDWDNDMCRFFDIPMNILPASVISSSEIYGTVEDPDCDMQGTPLAGILGDQQAALVGQTWPSCHSQFKTGLTVEPLLPNIKVTYGTGAFLLWNIGQQLKIIPDLLATVAYQMGSQAPPQYAIEGSIAYSGATMDWLRNNLGLFVSYKEAESLAQSSVVAQIGKDCDACYLVPAFSGLLCPHWREDARAIIVAGSRGRAFNRCDLIAAGYHASAYQTQEVIETAKGQIPPSCISVDGGLTRSRVLMQSLADITGAIIRRPQNAEWMTALGAGIASALAVGIDPSDGLIGLRTGCDVEGNKTIVEQFKPAMNDTARKTRIKDAPAVKSANRVV